MDEPLSNLDAKLRAEMRQEILALQRRLGITMIYVTHDQTEAMAMADQVVLLHDGRIEQDAPPAEIYATPATVFAAGFIGTPPMNLLPLVPGAGGMVARGTEGPVLASFAAGEVLAGVRPESLRLAEEGLPAVVVHAEYLGADTVLACLVGGDIRLLARLPGRVDLRDGSRVHLAIDEAALHHFDAESGRRLVPAYRAA
jgi:sn-glycerol 3-phosphate transport system ATP-binding protein